MGQYSYRGLERDTKGDLVHMDMTRRAHHEMSACEKLGWEWISVMYKIEELLQNKTLLTVLVDEQGQGLSVVGADVEQHGWTLGGPEAQGDILSSQRRVGVDGGRHGAVVPDHLIRLLEGVADRRPRLEAGRHLWRERNGHGEVFGNRSNGNDNQNLR